MNEFINRARGGNCRKYETLWKQVFRVRFFLFRGQQKQQQTLRICCIQSTLLLSLSVWKCMIAVCFWHREKYIVALGAHCLADGFLLRAIHSVWHWIVAICFLRGIFRLLESFALLMDRFWFFFSTNKINILVAFFWIYSFKCTALQACLLQKNAWFWCVNYDLPGNRNEKVSTSTIHCQKKINSFHCFVLKITLQIQFKKNRHTSNETSSIFEC